MYDFIYVISNCIFNMQCDLWFYYVSLHSGCCLTVLRLVSMFSSLII